MTDNNSKREDSKKSAYILAMVNVGIWAVAMVALVFVMQDSPGVKRLFPILVSGVAVGVALISVITKAK